MLCGVRSGVVVEVKILKWRVPYAIAGIKI